MLQGMHVLTMIFMCAYTVKTKNMHLQHRMCVCNSYFVPPSLPNLGMESVKSWVQFHLLEVAHAIIDIYDLPVVGLEENVADQYAALILSYTYEEDAGDYSLGLDQLSNVGSYYLYEDEYWNIICPESAETPEEAESCTGSYWDVHNLDIQRFYNISCYAYGSDPEYNQYLIEDGLLPEDRALYCEDEYWQLDYAWSHLLKNFTNGFFD